jgi:hypothetical protein
MIEQVQLLGTRMTPKDPYAKVEERNQKGDDGNPHFSALHGGLHRHHQGRGRPRDHLPRWPWEKLNG